MYKIQRNLYISARFIRIRSTFEDLWFFYIFKAKKVTFTANFSTSYDYSNTDNVKKTYNNTLRPTRGKLFIFRRLCRPGKTKSGNNSPPSSLQNKIPGELFPTPR